VKVVAVTASLLPAANGRPERISLNAAYVTSLESAGLAPVVLVPKMAPETLRTLISLSAGLVLTGGGDLDPATYGQQPAGTEMASISRERDAMEAQALDEADHLGLPILAICRGMQMLNVQRGGSLHQDIPGHAQTKDGLTPRDALTHEVRIDAGSCLARILGGSVVGTNSMHHQAVDRLGKGLQAVARSVGDDVIEGVEERGKRFVVGVQWHPEELVLTVGHARALFAAFAHECGAWS
jgi:putative glutamine amidotransferase